MKKDISEARQSEAMRIEWNPCGIGEIKIYFILANPAIYCVLKEISDMIVWQMRYNKSI